MRQTAAWLRLIPIFLAALAIAGCDGNSNPTSPFGGGDPVLNDEYKTVDLDAENGGFTTADENPYYNSDAILKIETEAAEPDEEMPADGRILDGDPTYDVYFLRIAWGQLDGDSSNHVVTNWNGSVALDRGGIRVRRVIAFEGRDHLLPRADRRTLEFVSNTTVHYDGLLLAVYVPRNEMIAAINTITFTTPLFTKTYTVDVLDGLAEVFTVDDLGNQVSFRAAKRPAFPCLAGYMTGFWVVNSEGDRGAFGGVWAADDGRPTGYVRGFFGVNREGRHVLYGKFISLSGAFRGLMRGTYSMSSDGTGSYEGHWVNRAGLAEGTFDGKFFVGGPRRVGHFEGGWRTNCEDQTASR
jgi:hypothetical protein